MFSNCVSSVLVAEIFCFYSAHVRIQQSLAGHVVLIYQSLASAYIRAYTSS
jgi:hypothetical protein